MGSQILDMLTRLPAGTEARISLSACSDETDSSVKVGAPILDKASPSCFDNKPICSSIGLL